MIICGRQIDAESVHWLDGQGAQLSQRERARQLCQRLNWMGPSGRAQLSVARQVVARLEKEGQLQPRAGDQARGPVRRAPRWRGQVLGGAVEVQAIECALEELGLVELMLVGSRYSQRYRIWKGLLERYHPLGAGPLCGPQLRYLIRCERGWLGAMVFSAAARRIQGRDQWIGWEEVARRENLHRVVNQSRFLIAPPVRVANLASHVLGLAARRIQSDWLERYGYPPLLLESFVELGRYEGTCYLAANWQSIGITAGRGRQDRGHRQPLKRKVLLVRPLAKDFRVQLCARPERRRLVDRPARRASPPMPPQDWAEEELGSAGLPKQRLRRRAMILARDFFARPQASVPQACGTRAKTKAAYRFFDHRQVSMQAILSGHYQASSRRAAQEAVVLAVQDTTDLNYSAHPQTEQLGPLGESKLGQVGLILHGTMLYNLAGTPLGLLDVQCWVRELEGMGKDRRDLPIECKESYKWLRSFEAASRLQGQCAQTQVVSVGDREADLYELLVAARDDPQHTQVLVRACQDRRLESGECGFLWGQMARQPVVATLELRVPRKQNQPARTAAVEVRYGAVELKAPHRKRAVGPVKLWAVWVMEVGTPWGAEPVEWMLLTNLAVESPEAALEKVRWYCLRFQIEVYHRTLKSGCRIEERQLGSAERIESCLGIDLLVAWRIVHLTKLGRETPEVPCTVFFEDAQWQAMTFYATGKLPPEQPPTLWAMILLVAQLGGFLGRKGDGPPGTKSLWLGLQRLEDMTEMWRRFKGLDPTSLAALLDSS